MGLFLIITPNTHGKVSEAVAKEKSAHGDVLCVVHERAPIAAASDHLDVKKLFYGRQSLSLLAPSRAPLLASSIRDFSDLHALQDFFAKQLRF